MESAKGSFTFMMGLEQQKAIEKIFFENYVNKLCEIEKGLVGLFVV